MAYLWLCTLLMWALNRFAPRTLDCAGAWLSRSSALVLLPVLPVLPVVPVVLVVLELELELSTFALSQVGFEMLRRVPLLRPCLGLAPARAEKPQQFVPSLTDGGALPTHAPERPPTLA